MLLSPYRANLFKPLLDGVVLIGILEGRIPLPFDLGTLTIDVQGDLGALCVTLGYCYTEKKLK